jgi:hypothetical protein
MKLGELADLSATDRGGALYATLNRTESRTALSENIIKGSHEVCAHVDVDSIAAANV